MIINNIPYIQLNSLYLSSISACISMVLRYNNIDIKDGYIDELYTQIYEDYINLKSLELADVYNNYSNPNLSCGLYVLRKYFPQIPTDVVETSIQKLPGSFIKRKIPIILNGIFPTHGGKVSNTILIKGFFDNFLLANDPKGNANSQYHDRFGENIVYNIDDLYKWIPNIDGEISILRIGE
jgi:hypothetical protein